MNTPALFCQYGLDEHQYRLIELHLLKVIEANKTTNLTRIETYESGMLLHVEDSLSGLQEIKSAPAGLYGDLGTGGGFPGIPLAIATGRQTMLVDSVKKKVAILSTIIEELGLEGQITGYDERIEDLSKEMKGSFAVLTARALSSLPSLMELASPLLMQGGQLICYKAHVSDEELQHVKSLHTQLGMKLIHDRNFMLSDEITNRRIIVFEKSGYPSLCLPRKVGMAQKKPL
ncbi:16S rRNA (guanine(527)-N(7))-methyltransferase RsmG [Raoultibacter phocaeensis]|uniref:16S rRNA (guanine(527)-N(7))-methyltransferase RsmG n=1 Tax=Raoultibacter phocaeensis TaxID=2479841 RepID=UPI00111921A8|nr:16S rRNA (guanine(527)-N(7))-methyltransferase RsmG [Raoultibacter phocaeensis]